MSWTKPRLFILLAELAALLRESNSLAREQIELASKRPARTPLTPTSISLPPAKPVKLARSYTGADVTNTQQGRRIQNPPTMPLPQPGQMEDQGDPWNAIAFPAKRSDQ